MTYSETLKIEKEIKALDSRTDKLYKEFKEMEAKQETTKDNDVYVLCIQKLTQINSEIIKLSTQRESLTDSL
jgi:hypothetical protein